MTMELFETATHYIVQDGDFALWCSRKDGQLSAKKGMDLASAWNPICLGQIYGVVGKVQIHSESSKLLLIRQQSSVGCFLGDHQVYAINQIAVLPLSTKETPDLGIERCKKHHFGMKRTDRISVTPDAQQKAPLQKTWHTIKSATASATAQVKAKKSVTKNKDKFDRRVTEELSKMFNDTESFYYSRTLDLTNSMQRQCQQQKNKTDISKLSSWEKVDDRFFWNKAMLQELINQSGPQASHWIVPVIQGFVQVKSCSLDEPMDKDPTPETMRHDKYPLYTVNLVLISRRSRYRAGTRYRRRGVDESGKCANYVETEQILEYQHHLLSFAQVRGSVPVFWSQPGYKYRPPPRLDKGEDETQFAFEKHFAEELSIYDNVTIINLVEQSGKEKVISDAYLNHILNYNHPDLTYVTFDFHEYCRGMRFENISLLTNNIIDLIKEMGYCWMDREGMICSQKGVFRVNCIDCLDRTNVVQTALARTVLEMQFHKLGVLPPEGVLPNACRSIFQIMWANNGDILSRQYAGTAALKGDYTRTGERRLAGMMKDGYNSANRYYMNVFEDDLRQTAISILMGEPSPPVAVQLDSIGNWLQSLAPKPQYFTDFCSGPEMHLATAVWALSRYYLNRFRDSTRQVTIDLMLGQALADDALAISPDRDLEDDLNWQINQAEHIKQLIEECKKILVTNSETIVGGWALVNADPVSGDPGQQDADVILILTRDSYYVAEYDDDTDRISRYQRVLLEDLEKIELGPEPSIFKSKFSCARFNYTVNNQSGFFHVFRSSCIRFFNNMAVVIKTEEESLESLKAICETFMVTLEVTSRKTVPIVYGKLERKRTKMPFSQSRASPLGSLYLDLPSLVNMPRNVSEGQLLALKNAGSKALSNMTTQIAKLNLNPMAFRTGPRTRKVASSSGTPDRPGSERAKFHVVSSSESDEDLGGPRLSISASSNDGEEGNDREAGVHEDVVLRSCGILATAGRPTYCGSCAKSESACCHDEDQALAGTFIFAESLRGREAAVAEDNPSSAMIRTPEIHISREDSWEGEDHSVAPASASGSVSPLMVPNLSGRLCKSSESVMVTSSCSRYSGASGSSAGKYLQLGAMTSCSSKSDSQLAVLKQSQSIGALGTFLGQDAEARRGGMGTMAAAAASLVSAKGLVQKEAVLAPFTKIAKGVQNISLNLRGTQVKQRAKSSPVDQALDARRSECRTRIIQL